MIEPVLVTGAGGFVGGHVSQLLRSRGIRVVAHARRPGPAIDWVADLTSATAMQDPVLHDIAAVVHCAAAIPARSDAFARDNLAATATLAAWLASARTVRRIVHLSSVSVYQRPTGGQWMIGEDAATVDTDETAANSYGASKLACERCLDAVATQRPDVTVIHLRASSIYGPGMAPTTLLPVLAARARANQPLLLRGPRPYVQNFVHVADVAELVFTAIQQQTAPAIINAFSDDTYELGALAELVRVGLDSSSQIVDESQATAGPTPVFLNLAAKRLHSEFRSLRHHLADAT